MDCKDKCLVSQRKIKKGQERMTTPRLTPTTEDGPLCLINSGRGPSDQTGHKSSSLQ
ncbi:hypothetical protein E2C01_052750 [Portunus trituberculatus]|uniref:Uncharacterized protein n=1 Tax=Portunus trituberculatus TaxID=210409 RepID=A0A5B7GFG5_PORTR|nr:hypothetical protein [Portunus trituberculatus]